MENNNTDCKQFKPQEAKRQDLHDPRMHTHTCTRTNAHVQTLCICHGHIYLMDNGCVEYVIYYGLACFRVDDVAYCERGYCVSVGKKLQARCAWRANSPLNRSYLLNSDNNETIGTQVGLSSWPWHIYSYRLISLQRTRTGLKDSKLSTFICSAWVWAQLNDW